jgi:hypothetical protein
MRRSVRELAGQLAGLKQPSDGRDVSLLGIMAGALYSLDHAEHLKYNDQRGEGHDTPAFADDSKSTLEAISRGDSAPPEWLAGFYFMSALFRLAALNDRIGMRFSGWSSNRTLDNLMMDVNRIKHNDVAHPVARLTTQFDDALEIAETMSGKLERELR